MKGCVSTDLGIITIAPEVIAKYAGTTAVESFGIVGMAAVSMTYICLRERVLPVGFRLIYQMRIILALISILLFPME